MHSKILSGLVLFAGAGPLASAIAIQGAMIDRRGPVSDPLPQPLDERGLPFCEPIKNFVNLLKVQQATSFCSSWLNIQTVSIPATQVIQTYITTTATIEETVTTTVTAATDVLTFAETKVIATLPTTVATSTSVVNSITTVFSTPPTRTVSTTTWTTPAGGAKAKKRDIKLPAYVLGFAPSAISKGCSCLELPTPTVTVTATSINPNTVQTQITKTETNTKYVTLTVSTTNTAQITTYTPVTATVTSTNVITSTQVLPEPVFTSTSTRAFRPQCTGLLAKSKLVQYVTTVGRRGAYSPLGEPLLPGDGSSEYTQSLCCEIAWEFPDCLYAAAISENGGPWKCRRYYSYDTITTGVSAQCPKGRSPSETYGPRVGAYELYKSNIVGPCHGSTMPL